MGTNAPETVDASRAIVVHTRVRVNYHLLTRSIRAFVLLAKVGGKNKKTRNINRLQKTDTHCLRMQVSVEIDIAGKSYGATRRAAFH
jgi:hypothetical protein